MTTAPARTTIELTIDPDYAKSWDTNDKGETSLWPAFRDLLQNTQDEAERFGTEPIYKYIKERSALQLTNTGTYMERKHLRLGSTTKLGTECRGQHGEGAKLAWLSLVRNGRNLWIKTGAERWIPKFQASKTFDGEPCLAIDIAPATFFNGVTVEIAPVSPEEWVTMQTLCLFLRKPVGRVFKCPAGQILFDPMYKGMLFSKGLFVGRLPGEYAHGYDSNSVAIDRDRKIADPWSLRWEIKQLLKTAVEQEAITGTALLATLMAGSEEAATFEDEKYSTQKGPFHAKIAEAFRKMVQDEQAIPVTSLTSDERHGVMVPASLKPLLDKCLGTTSEELKKRDADVAKLYSLNELEASEKANLLTVWEHLSLVEPETSSLDLQVVDFYGKEVNGVFSTEGAKGTVKVAKRRLSEMPSAYQTMTHEVAHRVSLEHGPDFIQEYGRLFGQMIVWLR